MITVSIYCYPEREESKQVIDIVKSLGEEIPSRVIIIDLHEDPGMAEYFQDQTPVVQAGPYRAKPPHKKKDIKVTLLAATERDEMNMNNPNYQANLSRGRSITRSDRFNQWFSKRYPWLFSLVLLLYVGLAVLAPVMMNVGADGAANVIYTVYKPFCHQLAFRSFFLFGEQAYYPRELAGIEGILNYEDVVGETESSEAVLFARDFIGNDFMGYKVAICERCLAIYGAMFLFSVVYALSGNRIKAIPWYMWILFGLGPIGLDGVSQLPGMVGINMPEWMIIRESTPLFRVVTGTIFGIMTFWFLMPQVEDSMRETRVILSKKFAYVKALVSEESNAE
ncbi:MAG: DUF2085 domain-containing protein [Anaerolineaceae bacterium]|nr:DUF2085 domain-containing protein [Anaerolineaceae bacterium]